MIFKRQRLREALLLQPGRDLLRRALAKQLKQLRRDGNGRTEEQVGREQGRGERDREKEQDGGDGAHPDVRADARSGADTHHRAHRARKYVPL